MHDDWIRYLEKLYTENGKSCGPADQAALFKVCAALPMKQPNNKPPVGQKKTLACGFLKEGKKERHEKKVGPEGKPSERISIKQAGRADPLVLALGQSIRPLLARLKDHLLDGFDWREGRLAYEIPLPLFLAVLEWMEPLIGNSGLA